MKSFFQISFSIILFITSLNCNGQNRIFRVTSSAETIIDDKYFELDHPLLNNNPNAKLITTHVNYGIPKNHIVGVLYRDETNKWYIYHEDDSNMEINSQFNIYIAAGNEIFIAINTSSDYFFHLDHPDLNGNQDAHIVLQTYRNPFNISNDNNYGVEYINNKWYAYNLDRSTPVPYNAAFFVLKDNNMLRSFKHKSTSNNSENSHTYLFGYPELSGNRDAIIFVNQCLCAGNSNDKDSKIGVSYSPIQNAWNIFFVNGDWIFQDYGFNGFFYDPHTMDLNEIDVTGYLIFPNPVMNDVTIQSEKIIDSIEIRDLTGKIVITIQKFGKTSGNINLSHLPKGIYILNAFVNGETISQKIVKK